MTHLPHLTGSISLGERIVKTMRYLLRSLGIGFLNSWAVVSRVTFRKPTCPVSKNSIHEEKRNPWTSYFSADGSQKMRLFPVGVDAVCWKAFESLGTPLPDVTWRFLVRENWITLLSFVPRTGRSISRTNEILRYDRDVVSLLS